MEARTRSRTCLAIVLAAGEGTRMYSARPKVLHAVAGKSLLAHVLDAVAEAGVTATAVVIGPGQDEVAAEAERVLPAAAIFVQRERRGTAHAVLAAKVRHRTRGRRYSDRLWRHAADSAGNAVTRLRAPLAAGAALAVLGFRPADPSGYGRLIMAGRRAYRHPRGGRRQRQRTRDRALQRRHSWRLPAIARLPSWSGSATTIANANSI